MFKPSGRREKVFSIFVVGLGIAFSFQNCSDKQFVAGGESTFSSESSVAVYTGSTNPTEIIDNHPDLQPDVKLKVIDSELILADRRYIKSILADFFGPSAFALAANDAVQGIISNAVDFADLCSVYRQYRIYNSTTQQYQVALTGETCSFDTGAGTLGADVFSKSSVTRAGWIERTCTNLIESSVTFDFALRKIDAAKANPDVNEENMKKVFQAFYRDRPLPPQELLDSLLIMVDPAIADKSRWKAPIYMICNSGYWQVL